MTFVFTLSGKGELQRDYKEEDRRFRHESKYWNLEVKDDITRMSLEEFHKMREESQMVLCGHCGQLHNSACVNFQVFCGCKNKGVDV